MEEEEEEEEPGVLRWTDTMETLRGISETWAGLTMVLTPQHAQISIIIQTQKWDEVKCEGGAA